VLLNKVECFKNTFDIVNVCFVKHYSVSETCNCSTALQIY